MAEPVGELNEQLVAETVRDWISDLVAEGGSGDPSPFAADYAYLPVAKGGLPDLIADTAASEYVADHPAFPKFSALQQAWLEVFEVTVSFMVEVPEDHAEDAQRALRGYAGTVRTGLRQDTSLDGRLGAEPPYVQEAAPTVRADFSDPMVEWADGTRGREARLTIFVAELAVAP